MLGSTCKWRFSRQLPIWSRKALFSSLSALRAAPSTVAARNVSSLPPHSQRAAAAAVAAEGQQAAMDTDGQSFGEAATARPFSDIPALKGWPVVGYVPQTLKAMSKIGYNAFYHKWQQKLGPIYKIRGLGNSWTVVVSGPEAAATLLRAEGKYPSRGYYEDNMMWIYKNIKKPYPMAFSGGPEWKRVRSAGSKQVLPQRVAKFVTPLSEIADILMDQLEKSRDEDRNISDVRDFTVKWSFQGVSYFVYGEMVDTYSEDPRLQDFMDVGLKFVQSIASISNALPLYRLHIYTKPYRDFVHNLNKVQELGRQLINRHYSELKEAIASGVVDDTKAVGLLDQWLIEGKYTEEEALMQSCDILSAGLDTTSNAALFLLFELAKHPEIQERLYREIKSVVEEGKHPTWEDIQNMKLVRNCVKETMRLYLPVGILPRVLMEDTVFNGYQVPAGIDMVFNMVSTGRDSQNFSNPDLFDPDRWDKKTSKDNLTFTSLPFGFGPRMCYGRRLAELELYVLLSKLIPKFRLSTDIQELELSQKTVLTSEKPVKIKMVKREQ